jgi:poly(A) polymerase
MYEEVLKLFHGGQALCVFEKLRHHGLMGGLFYQTEYCLQQPDSWSALVIPVALGQTDERIASDKGVHPGFLFAVMMWEPLWQSLERDEQEQVSLDEMLKAANMVLAEQSERTALTKPIMHYVKEVWAMQFLLLTKQDQIQKVMGIPRFRAGFDFLQLRAVAIPRFAAQVAFWQQQQEEHPEWLYQPLLKPEIEDQEQAFEEAMTETRRPKRRRRPRR